MERIMRHSAKRDRIYQYVHDSQEHPTADMIYQDLRKEIPNLSLGTVYRNLKQLEEENMLRRVTVLQDCERYDAIMHDHAHFVCRRCQMVRDLQKLDTEAIRNVFHLPESYTAEDFSVTITGLCDQCVKETSN